MITINDLTFAFKRKKPLFSDLNLQLEAGRTYGLFGLNGSGKTTLLNHMAGMLFPDQGRCEILGAPAHERRPEALSELFILPEQVELPSLTPRAYTGLHGPFYPRFDEAMFYETLKELEVNPDELLPRLSYGQRKKFLIAFGLAARTRILLMDEPTNGLDIPSKSRFRKVMAQTTDEQRCTVISTHQVRDLEAMLDHLTVLHEGRITFNQKMEAISRTLSFRQLEEEEQREERLYSESTFGGQRAICRRNSGMRDTDINLELLFNGIIHDPEAINQAFKSDQS